MPARIEFPEFERLRAAGGQVVEVLPADEYEWAHIPDAMNLPRKELDAGTATRLDRSRNILVYCHDYL